MFFILYLQGSVEDLKLMLRCLGNYEHKFANKTFEQEF